MGNNCNCDKNVITTDSTLNHAEKTANGKEKHSKQIKVLASTVLKNDETINDQFHNNNITTNKEGDIETSSPIKVKNSSKNLNKTNSKENIALPPSEQNKIDKILHDDEINVAAPQTQTKSPAKQQNQEATTQPEKTPASDNLSKLAVKNQDSLPQKSVKETQKKKRAIIGENESDQIAENVITLDKNASPTEIQKLKNILKNHYVFLKLAEEEMQYTKLTQRYFLGQHNKITLLLEKLILFSQQLNYSNNSVVHKYQNHVKARLEVALKDLFIY